MSYLLKAEFAKARLTEAENAFDTYVQNGFRNDELTEKLTTAVRAAQDESIDAFAELFPEVEPLNLPLVATKS